VGKEIVLLLLAWGGKGKGIVPKVQGSRLKAEFGGRGAGISPGEICSAVTIVPQLNGFRVQPQLNTQRGPRFNGAQRGKNFIPVPSSGATGHAG